MGSMSASDAAPLPRLGEVFFDVRGNSRSMRLSWYADTGVAVLSIWQGGMCTGTFRLAIADLPRMVETLQRGPGGQRPDWDNDVPGRPARDPGAAMAHVPSVPPSPQTGARYPTGPADDPRLVSTQYLSGPDDYGAAPAQHGAPPPDYLARPADHRAAAADYPPGGDYLADPPGYPADRPGYRGGPPDYPGYPAERPAQSLADYQDPLDPGRPPGAWNPGAERAYPGSAEGGGYQEHPYPGGAAAADYRGESAPHYRPGTSAPGEPDAPVRSAADYPAHYASTVTDEVPSAPSAESFPYGQPPEGRRAPSRHAAPDAPFD
jgi:hypothetical protein